MDRAPLYLTWYFLRVRRHHGEPSYLERRFENMNHDRMAIEVQMLRELKEQRLILLPEDSVEEKVFDPLSYSPEPDALVFRAGTQMAVPYWRSFSITPLGHYFIRETVASLVSSAVGTAAVAFVGALVALLING